MLYVVFIYKKFKMNLTLNFIRHTLRKHIISYYSYSTKLLPKNENIKKIRNIGISAHIDAGKTTTTERMLYYSGLIEHMGEVHDGNTVTDYMDQERERGITITSAAVTFFWKNHQFNLIDTPGHIDFTMEVEQTLNVLDGVIVILDGSAGVEAQTLTVWRQACRYNLPCIIYLNKMDRSDADIHMCCSSILKKLGVIPILLQLPVVENHKFVDVVTSELIKYGQGKNKNMLKEPLTEKEFPKLFSEAKEARVKAIETLADFDDELANTVIASESFENISNDDIIISLVKVTNQKTAVPVLLGSSYKNIGVQSLMDAVISYLPWPLNSIRVFSHFDDHFCGRAFKVIHDKQRGPLVFLRIYNGVIKKGQKIYSIQRDVSEQVGRVYVAYADDFTEVELVENGNIAVVSGLKKIMSGDLVASSQTAFERAKKSLINELQKNKKIIPENTDSLFGISAKIPEPVFFCSIESPSMSTQSALDQALSELQREDPSLRVSYNDETGQTVLAGMGELHLEIIRDRILKEYKIDADLGPLQISYREASLNKVTDSLKVETKIGNTKHSLLISMSLLPDFNQDDRKELLQFDKTPDNASNLAGIYPKHLVAIKEGLKIGLMHGPKINSQVINTGVMLHWFEAGRGTSETIISAAANQLTQKLLKESGSYILEPVVNLEVVSPSEYISVILSDLSQRRAAIKNVDVRGDSKVVIAVVPLSELLGYSTDIRSISSGTATFSTEFKKYQRMSPLEEDNAIRSVRGF
ncbi:ribosome-releasing factor 2, mitochondrial isoform X2 [Sitophilus oryzae]|uniref:Ribosome-releasing factor 2, mitochondrial isoform X2 n=1 Tax=Sitophilus oryzae TaxID=7048 RepID=A0A6J2YPQ7_SITOR|nr:ribosome-releasing factor 2, mitochondrial isoform X2 [Sitophilus oryzae]